MQVSFCLHKKWGQSFAKILDEPHFQVCSYEKWTLDITQDATNVFPCWRSNFPLKYEYTKYVHKGLLKSVFFMGLFYVGYSI